MEEFVPILFLIAIAEMIISSSWRSFYFETGIPLYRKSIPLPFPPKLSSTALSEHFEKGMFAPILFKQISVHQVAFREALFSFHWIAYTPVMHGLIRYKDGELQAIGWANWFAPVFVIFFAVAGSGVAGHWVFDWIFVVFPIGLFALLYSVQAERFNKIYAVVLRQSEVSNRN